MWAAMISQIHRSAAAGVRSFGRVQPSACLIIRRCAPGHLEPVWQALWRELHRLRTPNGMTSLGVPVSAVGTVRQ